MLKNWFLSFNYAPLSQVFLECFEAIHVHSWMNSYQNLSTQQLRSYFLASTEFLACSPTKLHLLKSSCKRIGKLVLPNFGCFCWKSRRFLSNNAKSLDKNNKIFLDFLLVLQNNKALLHPHAAIGLMCLAVAKQRCSISELHNYMYYLLYNTTAQIALHLCLSLV